MAVVNFTAKERRILKKNKFIQNIEKNRITYSDEFKHFFMENYLQGKRPIEIFTMAGLDPHMLGNKRIERASARWRKLYEEGQINVEKPKRKRGRPRKNAISPSITRSRPGRPRKNELETIAKAVESTPQEISLDAIKLLIIRVDELLTEVQSLKREIYKLK